MKMKVSIEHKGMFQVNLNSQQFDRLAFTHRDSESRTKCVHHKSNKTTQLIKYAYVTVERFHCGLRVKISIFLF